MNSKKRKELEQLIASGNLSDAFIDLLHWDNESQDSIPDIVVEFAEEEHVFPVTVIADKRGFVVFCATCKQMPNNSIRKKLEVKLTKFHYAHLLVVQDESGAQRWIYSARRPDKPIRVIDISNSQPGLIVGKLQGLVFSIEDEEGLGLIEVDTRVQRQLTLNAETVTRQFYEKFSTQLKKFTKFIEGIEDIVKKEHYASLMLNRLMFIYFIQKRGYLNGDTDYLKDRLQIVQKTNGKDKFYKTFYCYFLRNLLHRLSVPKENSMSAVDKLIGDVPYLNGGLFDEHQIEKDNEIDIADDAFDSIFKFFDKYQWYLDDSSNARENEINPDVMGYIFEKYINERAKMGAYYTKEDITGYIARNTILPALLQKAKEKCKEAFDSESGTIWKLLRENPDNYIYESVRRGCKKADSELPNEIRLGLSLDDSDLLKRRADWNKEADKEFALPGETWRECIARRTRYFALKQKIENGDVTDIADLTTYNLNIEKLTVNAIEQHEGVDFISAFYYAIAGRNKVEGRNIKERRGLTVLDPACGSGAFLFAALNVLQPLYLGCIARMYDFVEKDDVWAEKEKRQKRHKEYRLILDEVEKHPSEEYWICRNIILHNLFGTDIMPDAAEVAKLRLFLKLAAESEMDNKKPNMGLEPLPDIDFNIRVGNSLVGFSSMAEFKDKASKMLNISGGLVEEIEDDAQRVGLAYDHFINRQAVSHIDAKSFKEDKADLTERLEKLNIKLNEYHAQNYGIVGKGGKMPEPNFSDWKNTHLPFHWFVEFYDIVKNGGFDVVIGNPPYLEKRDIDYDVQDYKTAESNAVHCFFMERSYSLIKTDGFIGNIVPMALTCTQRMKSTQQILESRHIVWYSNFAWRPGKLFETVNRALSVFICAPKKQNLGEVYSTHYMKWTSKNRDYVFDKIYYALVPQKRKFHWVPKINDEIELSILSKMVGVQSFVMNFVGGRGHKINYRHTGGLYWKIFTDFVPNFYINGEPSKSATHTSFYGMKKEHVLPLIACLSSDVFWWHYTVTSNLRDLPPHDINYFPITENILDDSALAVLGTRYLEDIRKNSEMRIRRQKSTGETKSQHFMIFKSKKIIDEIDKILAKHYGFTDEELDYIINYDYKYRMSGAE